MSPTTLTITGLLIIIAIQLVVIVWLKNSKTLQDNGDTFTEYSPLVDSELQRWKTIAANRLKVINRLKSESNKTE